MQYCAAPRLEAAWRIRFSLKKCCTTARPRPSPPKIALSGTRTSANVTCAWSVGMLNVHKYCSIVKPADATGVRKAVMPSASPGLPPVRACVHAGVEGLLPVDDPVIAVPRRAGLHERRVGAVCGLGDAERETLAAGRPVVDPLGLLRGGAVLDHQQQPDVVADDHVLVLQVAVQSEALGGQVLTDHRHPEVGAIPPAV